MKTSDRPQPKLRASILKAEQLLALASDLERSRRRPPSKGAVVEALQEWVRSVETHAAALERKLHEIDPKLSPVDIGTRLRRAGPAVALDPIPRVPPPGEMPSALMFRMVRSQRIGKPVVWLLARLESTGIAVYEQYGEGTPTGTAPVPVGQGRWAQRTDGVWQGLTYVGSDESTYQVCVFWKGLEEVSVSSTPGNWTSEPWVDGGEKVGTRSCSSFTFANTPGGGVIEVTITVKNGPSHTFELRVDNAWAQSKGDDIPEPILVPTEPTDPPTGPGPILIPDDFAALPGVDPRDVGRILELFETFRVEVERALPPIVRDTVSADQLFENPAALQALLSAAAAGLVER